jgi:hypothetical protein
MDAFLKPNPEQNELSFQAKFAADEPTIEEIGSWDENKLLEWIQGKLSIPLKHEDGAKFLNAGIDGTVFFGGAGNMGFFERAGLSFGASFKLAKLAELARETSKHYLSCYRRNLDS